MGRRGPAPKPTAIRILEGNPGRLPLNENEPKPRARKPKAPAHLTEAALAEWNRIVDILWPTGVLTEAEADILAVYCDAYVRWVEAARQLRETGMVIFTEKGYPVQSPYLAVVNQCTKTMRGCMQELGLTPAARTRLQVGQAEKKLTVDDVLDAVVNAN